MCTLITLPQVWKHTGSDATSDLDNIHGWSWPLWDLHRHYTSTGCRLMIYTDDIILVLFHCNNLSTSNCNSLKIKNLKMKTTDTRSQMSCKRHDIINIFLDNYCTPNVTRASIGNTGLVFPKVLSCNTSMFNVSFTVTNRHGSKHVIQEVLCFFFLFDVTHVTTRLMHQWP